jgi:MoaA/NifB/PqqE/SkfB family radical SAM enzyme
MFDADLAGLTTLPKETSDDGNGHRLTQARPDRGRVVNNILAKVDAACLSEEVLAQPVEHYVATSDACNIECYYCPRQSYFGDRWENGFFSFEKFEEHILPMAKVAELMGLYGLGEPFLHRRFFDFVTASRDAGARTMTNCHGMSLKPKVNDRILDSGLSQLNVSIDGATEQTFNLLREGAEFGTVVDQVKDLGARRCAAGQGRPELYIATMINRENIREIPDVVRLAKELDAQQVHFSDTVICNSADLDQSVSGTREMRSGIAEAKAVGEELDLPVHYTRQRPFPWRPYRPDELRPQPMACRYANSVWLIDKQGDVNPCCFLAVGYGNVFSDDPEEIRNGETARRLRRSLMTGDLLRECRHCGSAELLTEEHQRRSLDDAETMIDAADLPDAETFDLRTLIAQRREMVDTRWAGGVDNVAVSEVTLGAPL